MGRRFPCTIGKTGISTSKREGDGASPAGVHELVGMLYRPDRIAKPASWAEPIGPGDLWSDDTSDPDYNQLVKVPHHFSHERLLRADPLYDLVIVTDWNWANAEPGKGSAIFIHQWRRPGYATEGCVAFSRPDLHWIARHLQPGSRLIIPGA
nr:L,D-transpeptidase family protein [Epibacterium ulvae]